MCRFSPLGLLAALPLVGCGSAPDDFDGPGKPGPPVPLKSVALDDVHGLYGGSRVWVNAEVVIVQSVSDARAERRYRRPVPADRWAEVERLVGAHNVLDLKAGLPRDGAPDESAHAVYVVARDGSKKRVVRFARDARPRLDPLARELFALGQASGDLIYEGRYEPEWVPNGFEPFW